MGNWCVVRWLVLPAVFFFILSGFFELAESQGIPGSSQVHSSALSNPLDLPGADRDYPRQSDSVFLSNGMFRGILPSVPNLEVGYLFSFGDRVRAGRLTFDYVLPVNLSEDSTIFGEAHGEITNFWKTISSSRARKSFNDRTDLSFGGGYRRLFSRSVLLGVNGFYDTSRLGGRWFGSGGFGIEAAGNLPGNDLFDLNFNWYGNLFSGRNSLINAFRTGSGSFDVEAGYSHELYNGGPDLRLKITGYQFDVGSKVRGWNAGAELRTRNGLFNIRAESGHDRLNGTYYTVGGFVNVGLDLRRLRSAESPFVLPEPVFASPRNLRRLLSKKVDRNWHLPAQVQSARSIGNAAPTEPYFMVSVSPTPCPSGGGRPGCDYIQIDETTATMSWTGAGGCFSNLYTIQIQGDTSSLVFPLTVTITPVISGGLSIFVRETSPAGFNMAETAVFTSAGQVLTIPPDGTSGPPNNCAPGASRASTGTVGTILVEATDVRTLTITVERN